MFDELLACAQRFVALAARADCNLLSGDDAAAVVKKMTRVINVASVVRADAGRRVEETLRFRQDGDTSGGSWFAQQTGMGFGQACDALQSSRAMDNLPATNEAGRNGQLSPAQLSEVTKAATADPGAESQLLRTAQRVGLARLREEAARVRAASVTDEKEAHDRLKASRFLRKRLEIDGAVSLSGRFTPEDLAGVWASIEDQLRLLVAADRRAGLTTPIDTLRADAFSALATPCTARPTGGQPGARVNGCGEAGQRDEADLVCAGAVHASPAATLGGGPLIQAPHEGGGGHGAGDPPAGPPTPSDGEDGGGVAPGRDDAGGAGTGAGAGAGAGAGGRGERSNRPIVLTLRVDWSAWARGHTEPGEVCEIHGIGPVPVAVAHAMAQDAFVQAVLTDGVDVQKVHRMGRHIPAALRAAILERDRSCIVTGCDITYGLELDHNIPVDDGGPTSYQNLGALCHHHHALKTFKGWRLVGATGSWRLEPPAEQAPGPP